MGFPSSVAGGSPSRRRLSANGNGGGNSGNSRDRVSRFFLLSVLLVAYAGVTLGLMLWNNGSGTSDTSGDGRNAGGNDGWPTPYLSVKEGIPARYPEEEGAAGKDGEARGPTSTQGLPGLAGGDGVSVGEEGSGATEDASSRAPDNTDGVAGGAREGGGSRQGDGLGLKQPNEQVRKTGS